MGNGEHRKVKTEIWIGYMAKTYEGVNPLLNNLLFGWFGNPPSMEVRSAFGECWDMSKRFRTEVCQAVFLGLVCLGLLVYLVYSNKPWLVIAGGFLTASFLGSIVDIRRMKKGIKQVPRESGGGYDEVPILNNEAMEFAGAIAFLREETLLKNITDAEWSSCTRDSLRKASVLGLVAWAQKIKLLEPTVYGKETPEQIRERQAFSIELRRQIRLLDVPSDVEFYFDPEFLKSDFELLHDRM